MKYTNIAIMICAGVTALTAQAQEMLWPIAGKSAGENILYKPQTYLDQELVIEHLIIGGEEGDVVICPTDGTIESIGPDYIPNIDEIICFGFSATKTMDENIASTCDGEGKGLDPQNIAMSVVIRTEDSKKITIMGFGGDKRFKTGQRLAAGDTLGVIRHSYRKIKSPSIMVSVTTSNNKMSDPMTPFGLESTFVMPEAITRENPTSVEKAREDLEVLKQAFLELYPSLENHMSKEEWAHLIDSIKETITEPIDPKFGFRPIVRKILHKTPDSHIALMPDVIDQRPLYNWFPNEGISLCNDTVRIIGTTKGEKYEKYIGRVVTHINGIPVKEIFEERKELITASDEKIESTTEERLTTVLLSKNVEGRHEHVITFDDGTTATFPGCKEYGIMPNETLNRITRWASINRQKSHDDVYETRELNDSTSLLAIRTFDIPDRQMEEIAQYLDTCKENLIIDLRYNSGGSAVATNKLLSYLCDKPMERQKGGHMRVNKRGKIDMLKYAPSYPRDIEMFMEYEQREDGCYMTDSEETSSSIKPDSAVNYKGKIYVLTNGHSKSAATLFPAVLVRNRRGVTVGRETGTTYHRMTALKNADITLPNTLNTVKIPLVQIVFDTTQCARLPLGRGLMPDYPTQITWREMTMGDDGKTDVMMEYALKLIAEGRYLSAVDPFEEVDREVVEEKRSTGTTIALVCAVVAALCGGLYTGMRKR